MSYLRIRNFWNYQNADVWKKAKANKGGHKHPAWCKLYVARDIELDALPPMTRLVFYELLRLATVSGNVIPNDISTIANAISIPRQAVLKAVDNLLEGAWLLETRSGRKSREIRDQIEIREEKKISKSSKRTKPKVPYAHPEFTVAKLLKSLTDADPDTEAVVKALARRWRLSEGDIAWALECATGPGVISPSAVAVAELRKRGEAKYPEVA